MHKTAIFINRLKELKLLKKTAEGLKKGDRVNLAIIGLRKIGKTELILKFKQENKDLIIPHINIQRVGNLNSFIFLYLRELIAEIGFKKNLISSKIEVANWDDLLVLATKLGVEQEVRKIKEEGKLDLLFETQETILEKTQNFCVYLLDELPYVLNLKKNFLEIMRSVVEKQRRMAYIVAGSAISLMEKIFSDENEPFFVQFRRIYLPYFSKEDDKKLVRTLLGKHELKIDDLSLNWIHKLTQGHPFYTTALCRKLIEEFEEIKVKEVKYAFLEEVLSERGDIYLLLDYIFNESLSRAYKGKEHKQILLLLAKEEGLILSEVARRLGKPSGEVSNYLKFLLKSDLIIRENDNYYFRDPLLGFWLAKSYLGIERTELKKEKILNELIKELEEKYQRASSELGKAKEYEWKVRLEKEFGLGLENYLRGKIEFDLAGEKNNIHYLFEIKHRNKPAGYNEVKNFSDKIKKSEFKDKKKKLFFVSESGFTKEAEKKAKKEKIDLITEI